MKTLSCADLGVEKCGYVASGEDDDEVVNKMLEHGRKAHSEKIKEMMENMDEDEIKDFMKARIVEKK